ncbi:unnamed protein product [Heterosigma akashiwo]
MGMKCLGNMLRKSYRREPFCWVHNQVHFASCFLPTSAPERIRYQCMEELLLSGLEIARPQMNIFISSETFDKIDEGGLAELSTYLAHWKHVTILIFHRPYYDWLGSLYNQI